MVLLRFNWVTVERICASRQRSGRLAPWLFRNDAAKKPALFRLRSKSMSLATTANVLPDFLLLLHASGGVGDDIVRKQ